MIARVTIVGADSRREGFLALRPVDGTWVPLGQEPVLSAEQAVQLCIDDIRSRVERLHQVIMQVDEALARLWEEPRQSDRLVVSGVEYKLEADGRLHLPAVTLPFDEGAIRSEGLGEVAGFVADLYRDPEVSGGGKEPDVAASEADKASQDEGGLP